MQADQGQHHVVCEQAMHVTGPAQPGERVLTGFGNSIPNITIGMPRQDALIQPRMGSKSSNT